jgi:uncharacterized protein (TIGR02646 family)
MGGREEEKMRRLEKDPEPIILTEKKAVWLADYLAYLAGDPNIPAKAATRYNHPDIKDAVKKETYDKCLYCESKITHTQPGDIEHILPKRLYPNLTFEWENLSLACRICNQNKGDYNDPKQSLINPYKDAPQEFLRALGPFVEGIDPKLRGKLTVRKFNLNRTELLEWRAEVVTRIQPLVELWKKADEGSEKEALRHELLHFADQRAEYTLVTKAYLESHGIFVIEE